VKLSFRKESFQLHLKHICLSHSTTSSEKPGSHHKNCGVTRQICDAFCSGIFVHPPISGIFCWANLLQRREKYHDIHLIGFFENTKSRMKDPNLPNGKGIEHICERNGLGHQTPRALGALVLEALLVDLGTIHLSNKRKQRCKTCHTHVHYCCKLCNKIQSYMIYKISIYNLTVSMLLQYHNIKSSNIIAISIIISNITQTLLFNFKFN